MVADDGIFSFEKGDFKCKFRDPTGRDILHVRYEHALLIQEKRRKELKHAEDADRRKDPSASNMYLQMQISDASDAELEYFAAAIIEPRMTVNDVANLPGGVFEALSVAFNRTIRGGDFMKFRLVGPGFPEDKDSRVGRGQSGIDDRGTNAEYAVERRNSVMESPKSC